VSNNQDGPPKAARRRRRAGGAGTDGPGRVELSEAVTLRTVEGLRVKVLDALSQHSAVEIDCTGATEVDLSGAQLLMAALKSAHRSGKSVTIVPPTSGVLRRALSRAGLTEAFESLAGTSGAASAVGASGS
jgi:anti-anti-sigma regulatory factor